MCMTLILFLFLAPLPTYETHEKYALKGSAETINHFRREKKNHFPLFYYFLSLVKSENGPKNEVVPPATFIWPIKRLLQQYFLGNKNREVASPPRLKAVKSIAYASPLTPG